MTALPPPTGQASPSITERMLRSQIALATFTVALLVAGWSIFLWFGIGSLFKPPSPTPHASSSKLPNKDEQRLAPSSTSDKASYAAAERDLLLGLQQSEITARLLPLKSMLEEVERLKSDWTARINDLKTSANGRHLATPELARKVQFLQVYVSRIDLTEIGVRLKAIEETSNVIRTPLTSMSEVDEQFAQAESRLIHATDALRQVDEAIDSMLNAAQIQQPNTLAVAIANLSQTDAQEIEDSVATQIAATEQNHVLERQKAENRQTQLKNEVADSLKRLKEAEAESKRKLAASVAAIESSAQAIAEKRAEARKQMEQAYPAVRSLLLPFTTPGYKQLNPKNCWEMTVDSKPASYSGLLRTGMLVDDIKYLKIFFNMSCSYDGIHFFNDRPQGDFPLETSEFDIDNPAILNKLRKAQAFLRTHGEAMVEAKLLSP